MKYLLITLLALSSCAQKTEPSLQRIYQPEVLILEEGKPIQTLDGVYTPKFREVWHSAKTVADLEKKLSSF